MQKMHNHFLFVTRMRLELTLHNWNYHLKVARLPIPPPRQLERKTGLKPATPSLEG